MLEQRLDKILEDLCLFNFMTILSSCFGNPLDNLRGECVIDPNLELVEVFKDEQDLVCGQGLTFTNLVHDEIKVPDHHLKA